MLYYVPHMRRFGQGAVEYCALVSMQMAQAANGEHFDTRLAVPASVARQGLPTAGMLSMFSNNGYIPVDTGNPRRTFTGKDLHLALQRFGPLIACGRIKVTRADYGHAVIVFGVDTTNDLVLLKDPNATLPQLGNTDDFSDATVIKLAPFNGVLARRVLGAHCLVGKPGEKAQLAMLGAPRYIMTGDVGRVSDGRSREV